MNKETIYIEPSDDITDILSKLKATDKKIVALVPPKKPSVLLSSVNVKLIARTAKAEKKAVVLITADDALIKLAMTANLPVAKSLKSRPVMPGEETKAEEAEKPEPKPETSKDSKTATEETDEPDADAAVAAIEKAEVADSKESADEDEDEDDEDEENESEEEETVTEDDKNDDDGDDDDDDSNDEKNAKKPAKKSKKSKKTKSEAGGIKGFLIDHKLWVILGSILIVAIVAFLVWAFVYAPEVRVAVSVRTSSANFSENVVFTTQPADESVEKGMFYVREEKLEKEQTVKFTATGKKDMGESATGTLVVYYQDKDAFSITLNAGSKFSHGSFEYISTNDAILAWDGESDDACETGSSIAKGCLKSASVTVKASAPGEDYNLSGQQTGWVSSDNASVSVYNSTDITGGSSRIVTVVQQSDIDLALNKLKSESGEDGKSELFAKTSNTVMLIESSFKVETTDPKVTPAVGEEVKEGTTPQISTKTTYSVLTVDSVRIEEFIKQKASVEEGKRLYSVGEPFVEYFSKSDDSTYSAKLKTTYKAGPEISETEVLEKIRGEKIGRIEPILKDAFPGISSVKTEKSYFWVNAVPSDENKIHIELTVEE